MDLFAAITEERLRVADLLDTLTPEQWSTQSCCAEWTVQETVGHMLGGPIKGVMGALPAMIKARGNVARANDLVANDIAAMGPEQLVATLRSTADSRFAPPGFGAAAPLTDTLMHGQDIARALGLSLDVAVDRAQVPLQTATQRRFGLFNSRSKLTGLRFESSDSTFVYGDGPTVTGASIDLAHAMWGRPSACDALTGAGVSTFRGRLS